jgi:hypothetical protein
MFQPTTVGQVTAPAATTPTVIEEQVGNNNTGIAVVPFEADKAVAVGAPVVLMGEERAASTIEQMIPVVPAEETAIQQQAPAAEAATEDEEEKALFPLLWSGSGAGAAGAGAGAEAGAVAGAGLFSTTGAKVVGIGLLLAAVALGIILPLTLSGGGGGGGSSGGDGAADGETGGEVIINPVVDDGGDDDEGGANGDGGGDQAPIPEPLTLILFGTGLIGLFLRKRND